MGQACNLQDQREEEGWGRGCCHLVVGGCPGEVVWGCFRRFQAGSCSTSRCYEHMCSPWDSSSSSMPVSHQNHSAMCQAAAGQAWVVRWCIGRALSAIKKHLTPACMLAKQPAQSPAPLNLPPCLYAAQHSQVILLQSMCMILGGLGNACTARASAMSIYCSCTNIVTRVGASEQATYEVTTLVWVVVAVALTTTLCPLLQLVSTACQMQAEVQHNQLARQLVLSGGL